MWLTIGVPSGVLLAGLGGWSAAAFARRRSTRAPEPIQPPVVPEDKISAASSTSSLISIRYRRCPVGREGLGGGGSGEQPLSPRCSGEVLLQRGF